MTEEYTPFEQLVHEIRIKWFDLWLADVSNWKTFSEEEKKKQDKLIKALKSYKRFVKKELKK